MNGDWKAKWIGALRSGIYQQGSGQLKADDGNCFCCLGVLCDIAGADWRDSAAAYLKDQYFGTSTLNRDAIRFFGIERKTAVTLAQMNDEQGKSFSEIADYIEQNL